VTVYKRGGMARGEWYGGITVLDALCRLPGMVAPVVPGSVALSDIWATAQGAPVLFSAHPEGNGGISWIWAS
jgi:hypothetical protein